jgi:hypothetical protein
MRENRTSGSEGGGAGYSTGPSYPYQSADGAKSVIFARGSWV